VHLIESVDRSSDGLDLCRRDGQVRLLDDGTPPPDEPLVTTRVGIRVATDRPWRFAVPGDPHVSRGRPS
jgi:DNA-3-methyladenine glycosylase